MRMLRGVLASIALLAVVMVAGCGSSDDEPPSWSLNGSTGRVTVTGAKNDTSAPQVSVTTPFAVTETQVHTLSGGDGQTVGQGANVTVNYVGVDGRTGLQFDSSYTHGQPAQFSLAQVVPGFSKAIAGQRVGSTVAVAIAPADGYPDGNPSAGINAGDTLVFAIVIVSADG
ncbi:MULTISPECIES: FKBP-type peptidyl-prolyl cis-trans isomerase [Gordonia]|nr:MULTISPECIES: FKBP-type peptidyl-prolyl cis-trans isomerase [Gordonia]MDF3284693.1 FKBP-type peptidyl-prolyl cis-trans isomerase [Gordonia sp. N1V]OPX15276.1 peptidylprolyl isomerase [Gordonia sp. i37]